MPSLVIAQGGGPTAVINQTLVGAVRAAKKLDPNLRILGARHGVRGLLGNDLVDLASLGDSELERLARTPNSGLGSTRDKPDPQKCEAILKALDSHEARGFIYIGGNDTAGTLELLRAASSGACRFVHGPKTIDNDLEENDHVPGFISAGTFVAQAFASVDLDFRAMTGVYVAVVMGRHAGFLTCAATAWQRSPDDAPHLVYAPEEPFDLDEFVGHVDAVYKRLGRCIVSISEGVQGADGRPLAEILAADDVQRDQHGNVHLGGGDLGMEITRTLKKHLPAIRARVDTLGYMPRGFLGTVVPADAAEAAAAGALAAERVFEESGSVALRHDGDKTVPTLVPLDRVAGRTRHMPQSFFAGHQNVSDEGRAYFARLLPPRPDLFTPFV